MSADNDLPLQILQGQIDGNVVRARFTLPQRQKVSPPPKAVSTAPKRDVPKTDNVIADKDGPKRPRERMLQMLDICYCTSKYVLFCLLY